MLSEKAPKTHTVLRWLTLGFGALSLGLIGYAFLSKSDEGTVQGRLLPQHMQEEQQWVTLTETDLREGRSLPAHSNVIIHIPEEVYRITRRTLFGRKGDTVRYWGYCFPESYSQATELRRSGFPGTLFLSEEERRQRAAYEELNRKRAFSVYDNLNEQDLNRSSSIRGTIRHQQEIFTGGMTCYVMTEEPLPIGIDTDDDGANAAVEREYQSNPDNPDSDGDGITDGLEIFRLGTHPTKRDSDGDGLIDGIEDRNRNGSVDAGETNPTEWDTDRDGLCDGLCKVNKGRELRGEDKNLDGIIDTRANETDPLKVDTNGDGVLDEQEYFNCLLAGGANC